MSGREHCRSGAQEQGKRSPDPMVIERGRLRLSRSIETALQSQMARYLGLSRLTVREKLDKYDLFPNRGG